MMDAVIYVKAWKRMCKTFSACDKCLLHVKDGCMAEIPEEAEMAVSIVEQWAKEHPAKTRQSEFLRMFPKAIKTEEGVLIYCPSSFDKDKYDSNCAYNTCAECRKAFWLTEVTDND